MKRAGLIGIVFALAILTAACSAASTPSTTGNRQSLPGQPPMPAATMVAPAAAPDKAQEGYSSASGGSTDGLPSAAASEQMVVYTVSLSLQVEDAEKTLERLRQVVAATNGGYVSGANMFRTANDKVRGTVTLRIPAKQLESTLGQIRSLGIKTLTEKQDSNDVTDQYVDLDARRRNLEATEVELVKLLDTVRERSNKAEDILAVYRELSNIRTQIEQIKGRQNVLTNTSALATVTVELVPVEEVQITDPDQWLPGQVAAQSLRQLVRALQGLASVGIGVLLFVLPLLIVIAIPFAILFWFVRWMIRRNRKPKTAAA